MIDMSATEMRVRHVLNAALDLDVPEEELLRARRLEDLFGIDSLAIIEFVTALEKEFRLRLDSEEITLELVRDLPRLSVYLDARLSQHRNTERGNGGTANDR